jgi:hypothetical protein
VLTVTGRRTLLEVGVNIINPSLRSLSIYRHIHCIHVAGALRMAAEAVGVNGCIRTGWTVAAAAAVPGGKTGPDSRHKMVAVDDALVCDSIQVSFSKDLRQNQIGDAIVRVLLRGIRLLWGVTRRARVRRVVGHHFSISLCPHALGKE